MPTISPSRRMRAVRGRSIASSLIAVQNRIEALGGEVPVEIVVNHHGGGAVARSQTHDGQQRETAVGGGLAEFDLQPLPQVVADLLVADNPAAHAVADPDHMPADRSPVNQVVEGGDAVHLV